MKRRNGPIHVATTKRHYKGKTYTSHLLRRTYRDGGKVKHETLGNVSHLPMPVIELIRRALRGETLVNSDEVFEIVRTLPHGHVAAVFGTLKRLGLDRLVATRSSHERDLVMAMIVARIIEPSSKLATARALREETRSSSLGEILGIDSVREDELYEAMDWLLERQSKIETALARKHLSEGTLVLYDVSSSYFEGHKCPLAQFGHNRDKKNGKQQIVWGLLCNAEGCPVAVEVFEGNTADPTTVSSQLQKTRERFKLRRIVFVGDRGMITEARLREEFRGVKGLDWISALRSPAIRKLVDAEAIDISLFDDKALAEITHPDYPDERLVVCKNPFLAEDRERKREELLQATEQQLEKVAQATRRTKRRLKGKDKIGLRVGRVLAKSKVGKHFRLEIAEDSFSYARREDKIVREAALDGLYVIRTSIPAANLDSEETVRAYKRLSSVERAFRSLKTVDLKVRPIHHRLADRVRAHIFLCMLAYYVEWHMRKALAPILFDDDDPESAQALRESPVAPAQRSPRAKKKASSKETEDGLPVHSFQTLLRDLATIAKNTLRPKAAEETFELLTTPTPLQRSAFDLLELPNGM